jgi:hypothetical protein
VLYENSEVLSRVNHEDQLLIDFQALNISPEPISPNPAQTSVIRFVDKINKI